MSTALCCPFSEIFICKMTKLEILLFFSILHQCVLLPSCISYPPHWDCAEPDYRGNENKPSPKSCPEGQSLLSMDDIAEMIDYVAMKLQVKENIVNSYNVTLFNVSNKYLAELKEFHEQLEDRPKHIKHILEDMETKRRQIEPVVDLVASKLQDIDEHNERFSVLIDRSNILFTRFEMYKKICQLNCENLQFDERYGYNEYKITLTKYPSDTSCWKIKDLYNKITNQLTEFMEEITREIYYIVQNIDETCRDYVSSYKNKLKSAAIQHFGLIMYEILSLQDDYYHFAQFINDVNVSLQSDYLTDNISKIVQQLVELERDVDKYGLHCMDCHKNLRTKRDIAPATRYPHEINDYAYQNPSTTTVDDLINMKIEEIRDIIAYGVSEIFEGLDEYITAYEFIDIYELLPIDETAYDVEKEREAFDALTNSVPHSSFNKILDILQKSNQILMSLGEVKVYLDSVITS